VPLLDLLDVNPGWPAAAQHLDFVAARVPVAPLSFKVGDRASDLTLPDAMGRLVSLADCRGRKPVPFVFYRGGGSRRPTSGSTPSSR
jgi:hypothetical protein